MMRMLLDRKGQMTVEFVVAFPVLIVVAVIAVNALLFFGECAAFDRAARDAARVYLASPGYGQSTEQCCAEVETQLQREFTAEYLEAEAMVEGCDLGLLRCTATLRFTPTLFGHGFGGSVMGVQLAPLEHRTSLVIEPYRPGVLQ